MKKVEKGEMGYRKYFRTKRLAGVGAMLAVIAVLVIIRARTEGTAAMLSTLSAVFMAIPMANYATPLIASWKWRGTPESTHAMYQKYEKRFPVLYDLILTTREAVMPVDVAVVHPTGVYCYCTNPKAKTAQAEKSLNAYFQSVKLDPNLHIFVEKKLFDRRINTLKPASAYEDDGSLDYAAKTLKSLCM
ncbi:O-linked GlcNAc transferase-like protein [Clostridium vitabionis]|uniref:O-linked GlcNAc transferase-like protein n=1 Tax=Clostridium vitabionis TaxID=2784388 RepID=UPI00188B3759|nr:O-linked GlcNAc transferase-like protein [Clostridium vitabionis]